MAMLSSTVNCMFGCSVLHDKQYVTQGTRLSFAAEVTGLLGMCLQKCLLSAGDKACKAHGTAGRFTILPHLHEKWI